MSMVCPQCNDLFDDTLQCPTCKARQLYQVTGEAAPGMPRRDGWQHTALGHVIVGLLVSQGLSHGLRMLCNAFLLAADEGGHSAWETLFGLVLAQALQGFSLLTGSALAGAGRARGALLGTVLGLLNGCILVALQLASREPFNDVALYGLPLMHMAIGTAGGLLGTIIWRPLPTLVLASAPGDKRGRRHRLESTLFAGPVSWLRVLPGAVVVVAGTVSAGTILKFVLQTSNGALTVDSRLQAELVTWEICALAVLLGAGIAGMNTANGLKQGLCVGLGASLVLIDVHLGSPKFLLEHTLLTLMCVMCLSLAGGWFGGQLFPPVLSTADRKRASLSRLG